MNFGYKATSNIGLMNTVEIPNVEFGFKNRVLFFTKDSFEIVVGIVISTVVSAFLIAIGV